MYTYRKLNIRFDVPKKHRGSVTPVAVGKRLGADFTKENYRFFFSVYKIKFNNRVNWLNGSFSSRSIIRWKKKKIVTRINVGCNKTMCRRYRFAGMFERWKRVVDGPPVNNYKFQSPCPRFGPHSACAHYYLRKTILYCKKKNKKLHGYTSTTCC